VNINTDGWEPRTGLAYQVNSKTVVLTGYGIYRTYFEQTGDTEFLANNPPFAYTFHWQAARARPQSFYRPGRPRGRCRLPTPPDLSPLSRSVRLCAAMELQCASEGANWMLTTAPDATVGTNGFGQTTAAGAPRQLQFGLKALF